MRGSMDAESGAPKLYTVKVVKFASAFYASKLTRRMAVRAALQQCYVTNAETLRQFRSKFRLSVIPTLKINLN